ncbi:MAG: hypothetical protein L0Y75_02385 [Acidobacteria bacterium]|nr:hypothetical protein [Acidobacteriota bacterium]
MSKRKSAKPNNLKTSRQAKKTDRASAKKASSSFVTAKMKRKRRLAKPTVRSKTPRWLIRKVVREVMAEQMAKDSGALSQEDNV